jgi:hypothetical protein
MSQCFGLVLQVRDRFAEGYWLRFRYGHPSHLKVVALPETDLIQLYREYLLVGLDSEVDIQSSNLTVVVCLGMSESQSESHSR